MLTRHVARVVAMHWKDATSAMPVDTPIGQDIHTRHRAYFCELGNGQANFAQLAALLARAPLRCGPIMELDACPGRTGAATGHHVHQPYGRGKCAMKGPGIFAAQFIGPDAPFNTLPGLARWAAGLDTGHPASHTSQPYLRP